MCNATFYIAFISCNICKRQALQTFHDIYTHDVRVSTATLSLVSPSCHNSTVLKFHTTRERQERWLVNNDFSGRVLLYMEAEAANGQPLLIEWAKEMHFRSTSDWVKRAAGELVEFLLMPEIIVGFHAENEIGDYFRITTKFYKSCGVDGSLPGFNTLDFIFFYHDTILPYWRIALSNPEKKMSKTFGYIDDNFSQKQEREFQKNIVKEGLKAAWDELAKMTATYFKAPLIYLSMTHSKHSVALLWAILGALVRNNIKIVSENGDLHDWADTLTKIRGKKNTEIDNKIVRLWEEAVLEDEENVIHWFQQLGLNRAICIHVSDT